MTVRGKKIKPLEAWVKPAGRWQWIRHYLIPSCLLRRPVLYTYDLDAYYSRRN